MFASPTPLRTAATYLITLCLVCVAENDAVSAEYAIHIHLDRDGRIAVDSVEMPLPESVTSQPGMLLWTDQDRDRWQVLPQASVTPISSDPSTMLVTMDSGSRGSGTQVTPVIAMQVTSLDQLVGGEVLRAVDGGGLITPLNEQMLLEGNITLRRSASEEKGSAEPYPAAQWLLRSDKRPPLRFDFPLDKFELAWRDIPDLPADLMDGLPEGEYTLTPAEGGDATLFGVESKTHRDQLLRHANAFREIIGTTDDPVYVQLAIEAMFAAKDDDGQSDPYLVDAYNLLAKLPKHLSTAHLSEIQDSVWKQIKGEREDSAVTFDSTGVAVIDLARQRITEGRWREAETLLQSEEAKASHRSRALARLYEAVILSESGAATGNAAYAAFMESLEGMSESPVADLFRAHNNFANFLLNRAQDRVYDHAFQIATGVPAPLYSGLNDWHLARVHYQEAEAIANSLAPHQAASVRTNIARQYALLADYLQLLNSAFTSDQQWSEGQQAAAEQAFEIAKQVSVSDAQRVDSPTRAGAFAMLARLAHRIGDAQQCRDMAGKALQWYLQDGSLVGVESMHRMIGVSLAREAASQDSPAAAAAKTDEALQHLLISHALAETLRDRFPSDTAGLSRAGFFARRAYVHEQIVELMIAAGRSTDALAYAELAKSRSLQDFLATRSSVHKDELQSSRPMAELLEQWPAGTIALEYFLGAERGWVFVVDTNGKTQAYPLIDEAGKPLASRDIVESVQQFVSGIRGTSRQMFQRHSAGLGFDKTWQNKLHVFYQQLIPAELRPQLSEANELLIVPHHILHYFPFAALVTTVDEEPRISIEMPQPTFLIDGDFQICNVPSLTAWDLLRQQTPDPIEHANAIGITDFENAPRLPGVDQDLANFSTAFAKHPLTILRGAEVDEAGMKEYLQRPGLLFVATHGMNIADQPLDSFLLCHAGNDSASSDDDGRLTAAEILAQPVASDVVVLSACYSGLADRSPLPGDDLFGLQRALLQSGASNVVCGLWDVYDETGAQLMNVFFQRLEAGDPVHAALGNSQRAFLKARRAEGSFDPWIHPYFWAVYKATGSDQTTMKTD